VIDHETEPRFWTPATLPRFKVGDRVRVRLSAECRANGRFVSAATGQIRMEGIRGHLTVEDGRSGTVVAIVAGTHPLKVELDEPLPLNPLTGNRLRFSRYAPIELEPLEVTP
jgi:hypothetical protein